MIAATRRYETVRVLDCTLRDGGYYTDWRFDDDVVDSYFSAVAGSRVDLVEVGYLAPGAGTDARSKVDRVEKFAALVSKCARECAFMLDAKAFDSSARSEKLLRNSLENRPSRELTTARIAVHFSKLDAIEPLTGIIADCGYRPVVNLMQIDGADEKALEHVTARLASCPQIKIVYIADSFGSMAPARVAAVVRKVREQTGAAVGFHAHENMGLALMNAIAAMDAGATWIDSTVYGMGRGAGNLCTEKICAVLEAGADACFDTVISAHFALLKSRYAWGESILYRIAARERIHPSYVQTLSGRALDVPAALRQLLAVPAEARGSFDPRLLMDVCNAN